LAAQLAASAPSGGWAAAASLRASATVAAAITTTAAARTTSPALPVCSVSPNTTTPSTAPVTGSMTVIVGSDEVGAPARMKDIAHRDQQRRTQGEQTGDIRICHRYLLVHIRPR
jgi:hypothetical protein